MSSCRATNAKVLTPEQIAELRAQAREAKEWGLEITLVRVWKLEALLDAAERCARVDTYLDDMQDSLTTAIARAEAAEEERDRMRPVVESAVAEYRAADAANDETEPDDTQVQRNGRWAKAETTLHIAVHNYLGNDHAKGGG